MQAHPPSPRWHLVVIGSLSLIQILCGVLAATASSDTSRDLYFAQRIASGSLWPLMGPTINSIDHLGPIWYYVLALPLVVVPNAAAVTGFMAAISSLQFPLAYAVGRRILDARFGILFAASLAIPGWIIYSFAAMTHTLAVIPSILFGALATLRYREAPSTSRALLVGLAGVCMVNAHPTALLLLGLMLLACAMRARAPRMLVLQGAVVAAPIALSVAPMLYAEWAIRAAGGGSVASYAGQDIHVPPPSETIRLVYAVLYFGPQYASRFLGGLSGATTRHLMHVYELLLALSCIGLGFSLFAGTRSRTLVLAGTAVVFLEAMFLCAVRRDMPPWMVYALVPALAFVIALGIAAIADRNVLVRGVVILSIAVAIAWTFAIYLRIADNPLDHADVLASAGKRGIWDVRDYEKAAYHYRLERIPFRDLFALGKPLCKPVSLFGHYGYLVDSTYAVSVFEACGTAEQVRFGGLAEPARTALLGFDRSVWQTLGASPQYWIGPLGVTERFEILQSPTPLAPVTPELSNWPRVLSGDARRVVLRADASRDSIVVLSHRTNRYLPFRLIAAKADDRTIDPVYSDVTTIAFRAPAAGASSDTARWTFELEANPDYVDVLTLR